MLSTKMANNEKGFTMVELFIYMAIFIVVLGALYSILITNTKSYSSQENKVEMTQDLRAAMELMVTEIRMACCDPTEAGSIGFVDNADDRYNTDANSIHYTTDSDASGTIANSEDINYYRKTSGGVQQILRRTGDGSESIVAENITSLRFNYMYADGEKSQDPSPPGPGDPDDTDADSTNDLNDIRSVQIRIDGETAKIDPVTGVKKTRTQTSWVAVRNAGL